MAVNPALIGAFSDEFAGTAQEKIDELLPIANVFVSDAVYGAKADYAKALLVCHFLKFKQMKGNGEIKGEKVGDISRTYKGSGKSRIEGLELTSYGKMFLALSKTIPVGPICI